MKRLISILSILLLVGITFAQEEIPRIRQRSAQTMNANERKSVNQLIRQINSKEVSMIKVVIDPTETYDIWINESGSDQSGDGSERKPVRSFERAAELAPSDYQDEYVVIDATYKIVNFHLGPGSWSYKDIQPFIPDYYSNIIGDSLEFVKSISVTRTPTDTLFYSPFDESGTPDSSLVKRFIKYNGRYIPVVSNIGEDLWISEGITLPIGDYDIYDSLQTTIVLDSSVVDLHRLDLKYVKFEDDIIENAIVLQANTYTTYTHCRFNLDKILYITGGAGVEINRSHLDLKGQILAIGSKGLSLENNFYNNATDNTRNILGVSAYGSDLITSNISGYFKGFSQGISAAGGDMTIGSTHIDDAYYGVFIYDPDQYGATSWDVGHLQMHETDTAFYISDELDNYQFQVDDFLDLGLMEAVSNVPVNIRSLNGDQSLFVNKDTATVSGRNYLSGDLELTGAITRAQISASLTDGAPTAAELNAATGSTPGDSGAGWSTVILDSDGTGLIYRIQSDGTNWQYQTLTIAL